MTTTTLMTSLRKKCAFDDDDDQRPSSTPPLPPKRQTVGDDDSDRDDEPSPLSEDRKLFERRAHFDDGDTSSESVEYVGYHTIDNSDDTAVYEFSEE
jgi:hypothetical protein